MLVGLDELSKNAIANRYAVGMFNVCNLEFAEAIVAAAEELKAPVMLGLPERFFGYYSIETVARICVDLASQASVPIAVHLDHGKSMETVLKAIRNGFTSVMFDGSTLPYEENIRQTAEIVKVAKVLGVSVEGELGHVGRASDNDPIEKESFTKTKEAVQFVEKTGVDALAIAIGTIHGVYKGTPHLDFERLKEIRSQVGVGLVLHGGSGLSNDDFTKAIQLGINKVNIYTELSLTAMKHVAKVLPDTREWLEITKSMRGVLTELVKERITVFGGAGRAITEKFEKVS
jgi:fructose-bisphosphate aldolase, class II